MKVSYHLFIFVLSQLEMRLLAIDQFRGAVYEHEVIFPSDRSTVLSREQALNVMMKNLKVYSEQANKASAMRAKIIVFPEYGLYGLNWTRKSIQPYLEYIPPVNISWNPCNDRTVLFGTEVQRNLSCIAKHANIYLVANMGAEQPCTKTDPSCPPDMHYQYSVNVVYASNGDFIARYFKYNLNDKEMHFDKPIKPDFTTFDTPFGRFGTFTSADILYHDPAVQVIKDMKVANIVYPTAWKDNLPLMAAIEFHSAFAEGMLINLLAANLHIPSEGYHGSGLYWPIGASFNASYYYNAQSASNGYLIVEDMVPFIIPPKRNDDLTLQIGSVLVHSLSEKAERFESADNFEMTIDGDIYTALVLSEPTSEIRICHGSLCCVATFDATLAKDELYVFGAFDGLHTSGGSYYLQACVIIKCANQSKESCGAPTTSASSNINAVALAGNFTTKYIYPEVMTGQNGVLGIIPATWYFRWTYIILSDISAFRGTLSVSLLARDYSRDPET